MITDTPILSKPLAVRSKSTWIDRLSRKFVCKLLAECRFGYIHITDMDEELGFGDPQSEVRCHISIKHPGFWTNLACLGSTGSGISYQADQWECDDLTALVRIICRNNDLLLGIDGKFVQMLSPIRKLAHRFNRNTVQEAKNHIKAHYDIGNDLFKLMLDEKLMYSAAIYKDEHCSLSEASIHKLDVICQKLELSEKDHVVEIGTGWGGFAIHASEHYGCRVTTTTISDEQYQLACERAQQSPAADRITILNKDYRLLEGKFDKLVSIEMIEAIGHQYFTTFFKVCSQLLKDNGKAVIQAITLADQQFHRAKREVDFIKRYIFPGCCIPSVTALTQAATSASDLHLESMEDYSAHYAKTLHDWRIRFNEHSDALATKGYQHAFQRLWNYYLAYCEGGFAEHYLQSKHFTFVKPGYRNKDFEALGYPS